MTSTQTSSAVLESDNPYANLSLNTMTTKSWTLPEAVDAAAAAGLGAVGLWRDRVHETGVTKAARIVRDAGLRVSSLCRGGFLTDLGDPTQALDSNRQALDEAAELGTHELVMVAGGVPDRDLVGARRRLEDRLAELVPYAAERNVRMALEPLHPMYCADRAVISTLDQALTLAAPHPAHTVGVVVDTFHIWWDPEVSESTALAGKQGRISSYQVCDWLVPMTADPLLSRGMMGDGVIDFTALGTSVRDAGYEGDIEVEIFNESIWERPLDDLVRQAKERFVEVSLSLIHI